MDGDQFILLAIWRANKRLSKLVSLAMSLFGSLYKIHTMLTCAQVQPTQLNMLKYMKKG